MITHIFVALFLVARRLYKEHKKMINQNMK